MKENWTREEVSELLDEYTDARAVTSIIDIISGKGLEQFKKDKGLMPSLEVGKWYWSVSKRQLSVWNNGDDTYGFCDNKWSECLSCWVTDRIPATKEEIQEALIKEAKNRGFKEGVKAVSVKTDQVGTLWNHGTTKITGVYFMYKGHNIMSNGKWAEIIEAPTKLEELEKQAKELLETIEELKSSK